MSDIKRALTADEWAQHKSEGPPIGRHSSVEGVTWLDPEDRHAAAALALHGEPFGFTWADVDAMETAAGSLDGRYFDYDQRRLREIAARIAALLPPRDD